MRKNYKPITREEVTDNNLSIYFDTELKRIDKIKGQNVNLYGQYYLKKDGDYCYDIQYYKNTNRLKILRMHFGFSFHGNVVTQEFWCSPPQNKGDIILINSGDFKEVSIFGV